MPSAPLIEPTANLPDERLEELLGFCRDAADADGSTDWADTAALLAELLDRRARERRPKRMTRAEADALEQAFWNSVEILDECTCLCPFDTRQGSHHSLACPRHIPRSEVRPHLAGKEDFDRMRRMILADPEDEPLAGGGRPRSEPA